MRNPSPCPRCRSRRWWDGAPLPTEALHAVACPGCTHQAAACTRCGWEFTGIGALDQLGGELPACISCVMIGLARGGSTDGSLVGFLPHVAAQGRSRLVDGEEGRALRRFLVLRGLSDAVGEGARRATLLAGLEARLLRAV